MKSSKSNNTIVPAQNWLCAQPDELLLKILQHLDANDIIQVRKTCRRLNAVTETHWKRLARPKIRLDFTPALQANTPVIQVKFCRTSETRDGAPYIFSLYSLEGKIQLCWSKGGQNKKIFLNWQNESCNSLVKKEFLPPPSIAKAFRDEVLSVEDAFCRLLRVHLVKAHIRELNFRNVSRPLRRFEVQCLSKILKETSCEVERVYFGSLDPFYLDIVEFTGCRELSVVARNGSIDLVALKLPLIFINGDTGISVDTLIMFTKQWELGTREIQEFRLIRDLDVQEIISRVRLLSSYSHEEGCRLFLVRRSDGQKLAITIEHNSLRVYSK